MTPTQPSCYQTSWICCPVRTIVRCLTCCCKNKKKTIPHRDQRSTIHEVSIAVLETNSPFSPSTPVAVHTRGHTWHISDGKFQPNIATVIGEV